LPPGKIGQNFDRVVGDHGHAEALRAKLIYVLLQLDELRLAVRSPIGRAKEHQHRAAGPHDRLQVAHAAGLVSEVEIRNLLPYLRAQLGDLDFLARLLRRLSGVRTTHTDDCEGRCQRGEAT